MDSASEIKNPSNVIGGHKANLHNPNTSVESKERPKNILEGISGDTNVSGRGSTSNVTTSADTEGKNPDNIARGYKAALSNPNVSEEAKERVGHKFEEIGQH